MTDQTWNELLEASIARQRRKLEADERLLAAEYVQLIHDRRRFERRRPHLPRFLHRWYARALGYFWLPCPLCREPFGGHQVIDYEQSEIDVRIGRSKRVLCPRCVKDGAR